MKVRGVVKGKTIVLDEATNLEDGRWLKLRFVWWTRMCRI